MNPKRRFFQIHLSTAVVLMLVAGVLVWANVRGNQVTTRRPLSDTETHIVKFRKNGWPFVCRQEIWSSKYSHPNALGRGMWTVRNAVYDALIALAILLLACVACEWRMRRYFPIHLSTTVVVALLAGMLVWANVRAAERPILMSSNTFRVEYTSGWPFVFKEHYRSHREPSEWNAISSDKAMCNAAIALTVLLIVSVACEWLIRRRAARKANE